MTPLEDELRGSLARQAGHLSPARTHAERAELAIRRARRRRRRQWTGGATTVLVLVAATGLSLVDRPERRPAAPPAAAPPVSRLLTPAAQVPPTISGDVPGRLSGQSRAVPKLPIDVVADDRLVTVDGDSIDVSFAGEVSQAYRVDEGWLVVGVPEGSGSAAMWLVTAAGHQTALLSDLAGVAFDETGHRLAWRSGSQVFLGQLSDGRLTEQDQTAAVARSAVPVGFVAGAVLLARGRAGGYDLWWPERGIYRPVWAQAAAAVYGSLADGRTAVGQVVVDAATINGSGMVGGRRCLALFDVTVQATTWASRSRVRQAKAVQPRCRLGLSARSPGWVSPDGRWLVTGAGAKTVLVDLSARSPGKPQVLTLGPPIEGGVAWLDNKTVVLATNSGKAVMRLRIDELHGKQAAGAKQFSIPVVAKEAVLLVPRL